MVVRLSIVENSAKMMKIDDSVYFGNEYSNYIDNSILSLINEEQGGSISLFNKGLVKCYKSYFDIGHAVHSVILENGNISDVCKPSGDKLNIILMDVLEHDFDVNDRDTAVRLISEMCSKHKYNNGRFSMTMINNIYDKSISFIKDFVCNKNNNISYLSEVNKEIALKCIDSLKSNNKINDILNPADDLCDYEIFNEYAVTVDVKVEIDGESIIIPVKGKFDNLVMSSTHYYINDLKTTFYRASDFNRTFNEHHYYRQAAFYKFLFESLNTGLKFGGFNFICVSTSDYSTGIKNVHKNELIKGKEEFIKLIIYIALIKMAKHGSKDIVNIFDSKAFSTLAVDYNRKIAVISLLCFLKQAFEKKGEKLSARRILEKVRKDKFEYTSERLVQALSVLVDTFYSFRDTYPTYNCKTAKDISNMINEILDKELPFSNDWDCDDDLPF